MADFRFNVVSFSFAQGPVEPATLRIGLKEHYSDGSETGEVRLFQIQPPEALDPSDSWLKDVLVQVIEQL